MEEKNKFTTEDITYIAYVGNSSDAGSLKNLKFKF